MSTTTSRGSTAAKPSSAGSGPVKELTARGIIIGGIITLIFTAANVYLGLKVGLTFATSIPAAVISMAILRRFSDHTIQENNIVQTIASAAGTLSAIIFVLPGLIIVGWWTGFPYLQTVLVIILGGILGVTYSIPLRRALVTNSDLPYPEGVAGAEVLRVGDTSEGAEESSRGLGVIVRGSVASAALYFLNALKAISVDISGVFVGATFASEVRIVGAGAIAIAAIWTFLKILGPIVTGIRESLASSAKRDAGEEIPLTERDLSMKTVIGVTVGSMLPIGVLLWLFLHGTSMAHHATGLIIISILFILLTGLVVASVCGYMAGLIGSSNSPISGVGILVAVTAAALVRTIATTSSSDDVRALVAYTLFVTAAALVRTIATTSSPDDVRTLVAYTLFVTAVVFGVATISNDNLQDLKTGQLVDSTPWKQQVALVIGVVFGAIVIPPVLSLMQGAFGFAGAPDAGDDALAAPQANLIKHLVQGVLGGDLNWSLLGLGALIGAVVIAIDEILRRNTKYSLPPLAVGMGMYLPTAVTVMIPIGAALGHLYDRWAERTANPERAKRMGTLMATGLIVGESLAGVVYAGIVVAFGGKADPLAIMPEGFAGIAPWVGVVLFVGTLWYLYRGARQESSRD